VLGIAVGPAETEAFWMEFLRSTRHEDNPEPAPAENDSLMQPHPSPYRKKCTSVGAQKSKRRLSAPHRRNEEVIPAGFP